MTRDPKIMELLKIKQSFLSFLKSDFPSLYSQKEIDKIIDEGDQNNAKLYPLVNDVPLLQRLDIDEMTTEEVYDKVMSKDSWIFMSGPKHEEDTNKDGYPAN